MNCLLRHWMFSMLPFTCDFGSFCVQIRNQIWQTFHLYLQPQNFPRWKIKAHWISANLKQQPQWRWLHCRLTKILVILPISQLHNCSLQLLNFLPQLPLSIWKWKPSSRCKTGHMLVMLQTFSTRLTRNLNFGFIIQDIDPSLHYLNLGAHRNQLQDCSINQKNTVISWSLTLPPG